MAWLLIDNSNTRTKLALGDRSGLAGWRGIVPTDMLDEATLGEALAGVGFDAVAVASVVPDKAAWLAGHFGGLPYHRVDSGSPLGYGFALSAPQSVGADRLANATALKRKYGFPAVAIDFGTAVTFSVLSDKGDFSGGAIAPGMAAMTSYLSDRTAQLPSVNPEEPRRAIGRDTREAILSGAVYGHRGLVSGILRRILAESGRGTMAVATGGGAAFGSKGIDEIGCVDPDLTLEGIRLIAAEVFGAGM